MKRRPLLAAVAAAMLIAAGLALASAGDRPHRSYLRVAVTVGSRPISQPLPPGFLGLSLEYTSLRPYAGDDPRAVDPPLIRLIADLSPAQRAVLRIGGNSTDRTWLPRPGGAAPRNARFALSERWLQTTRAVAAALDARMIMGLNLAAGRSTVAVDEARAFRRVIGRRYLEALEIGNEPDVYGLFPWSVSGGRHLYARPHDYSPSNFTAEFSRWRAPLGGGVPVAGPAFATADWTAGLGRFIDDEPGLAMVTLHRYPLRACVTDPAAPGYPTIPSLLRDQSSAGLAEAITPDVAVAHSHHLAFRLDEFNSVSCSGKWEVSNTFASALWMLDTLFNLASVGVDGVNVHTFSGAAYAPFRVKHTRRGWEAFVCPEYYGMLMFTQAFPAGARLLPVYVSPRGPLKAWATQGPAPGRRVVLINKDPKRTYQVELRVRGASGPMRLERLEAPSPGSTRHVTLGGRTFGDETTTGRLRRPRTETVRPDHGAYSITVPAASAVLVMK